MPRQDYDKIVKLACKPKNAPPKAKVCTILTQHERTLTPNHSTSSESELQPPNAPARKEPKPCLPFGSTERSSQPSFPVPCTLS